MSLGLDCYFWLSAVQPLWEPGPGGMAFRAPQNGLFQSRSKLVKGRSSKPSNHDSIDPTWDKRRSGATGLRNPHTNSPSASAIKAQSLNKLTKDWTSMSVKSRFRTVSRHYGFVFLSLIMPLVTIYILHLSSSYIPFG